MNESQAADMLGALAQETRLKVLRTLIRAGADGVSAGGIAEAVGASASNISFHLSTLEAAGLIASRRQQRSIIYTCNYDALNAVIRYLVEDCCKGLAPPKQQLQQRNPAGPRPQRAKSE